MGGRKCKFSNHYWRVLISVILLSQIWLKVMPFAFALAEGEKRRKRSTSRQWACGETWVGLRIVVSHSVGHVDLVNRYHGRAYLTFGAARNQSREFALKSRRRSRVRKLTRRSASPTSTRRATWRWWSTPACKSSARTRFRPKSPVTL